MTMKDTIISAQLEPKRKRGRPEGFVTNMARETGQSKATIKRALRRANNICQDARDLIRHSKLDTGAYLDALIKMDLTDAEQVEQVRRDLAGEQRPAKPKTATIRHDHTAEVVANKLRSLYDDDMLAEIWRAL